jgi:very-short-patch-repair endonuclease
MEKEMLNAGIDSVLLARLKQHVSRAKKLWGFKTNQEDFIEKAIRERLERTENVNVDSVERTMINAMIPRDLLFRFKLYVVSCKDREKNNKITQERVVEQAIRECLAREELRYEEIRERIIAEFRPVSPPIRSLSEILKMHRVQRKGVEEIYVAYFGRVAFNVRFVEELFRCNSKLERVLRFVLVSEGFVSNLKLKTRETFYTLSKYRGEIAVKEEKDRVELDWAHTDLNLNFEIDEKYHAGQIDADLLRDKAVQELGFRVYRIREFDIFKSYDTVKEEIKRIVSEARKGVYVKSKFDYEKEELRSRWQAWQKESSSYYRKSK